MSILNSLQSASIRLIGQKPGAFFASSEEFELELFDFVNEVAKDICKYADWQALTKLHAIAGDGITETFALLAEYDRRLLVTDIQDLNNWYWDYQHIANINDFLFFKTRGAEYSTPGAWTIYNNELNFFPAPAAGSSAIFPYVSANYAVPQGGGIPTAEFMSDSDEFIIRGGERLLTLGLVWRWRENKKLDYTGDQEAFMMLIDQLAAKDKGSTVIRDRSNNPDRWNTGQALPGLLGPLYGH
ncbi:hypothetical protein [Phyllobacterium sp. SB3]|uniref:phage adaptor protein n=1 Tax=Phyllobacterium sp. SB3 TaxID=3156073 RepID=UPI0032AF0B3D